MHRHYRHSKQKFISNIHQDQFKTEEYRNYPKEEADVEEEEILENTQEEEDLDAVEEADDMVEIVSPDQDPKSSL